jgi:hypothetical protein
VDPNAAVYFDLVVDPATAVNGDGTWKLFALDANQDSLGISTYCVNVTGATSIIHNSPVATVESAEGNTYSAGFNLLRSGSTSPIHAAQNFPDQTLFHIPGFGKSASNFESAVTAIDPTAEVLEGAISETWGSDPNAPATIGGNQWMLIAQGTYGPDGMPAISAEGTLATVYNSDMSSRYTDICIGSACTPVLAPNRRVPPPVDPVPDPVVPPPVVGPGNPVPDEVAPPAPAVPPYVPPI